MRFRLEYNSLPFTSLCPFGSICGKAIRANIPERRLCKMISPYNNLNIIPKACFLQRIYDSSHFIYGAR